MEDFPPISRKLSPITATYYQFTFDPFAIFTPGTPLTYFNDGEGGGVRVFFLGLKFWPKVIFWVYERRRDFFGSRKKKRRNFFWHAKKELRNFLGGMLKIVVILLGRQILKL